MAGTGGITPFEEGLSFNGIVSQIISPTVFLCPGLAGFGDAFFQDWDVWVVRQNLGTGAAPQGDKEPCTVYTSSTGQFTVGSAWDTAPLSVGDQIYLIQPYISENINVVDQPSDNVKESLSTEVSTHALVLTKVDQLPFTGKVGGARVKFSLKVNALGGLASAVIYKNGVAVTTNPAAVPTYTVYTDATGIYHNFSQDISGLAAGDLIQIYAGVNNAIFSAYVKNFTISYDIVSLPSVQAAIDTVYFDSIRGVSGTEWPVGTAGNPVNNWPDARTIAIARNLNSIQLVNGVITLDQNTSGYHFIGNQFSDPLNLFQDNCIQLNGFILSNSSFESINIGNTLGTGSLYSCGYFNNCARINALSITLCYAFLNCGGITAGSIDQSSGFVNTALLNVTGAITNSFGFDNVAGIGCASMTNCWAFRDSGFQVLGVMTNVFGLDNCQFLIPETISFTGYAGLYPVFSGFGFPVTLTNFTSAIHAIAWSGDFSLIIAPSCTAGVINVYGDIALTNGAGGATVNDYTILHMVLGPIVLDLDVPPQNSAANVLERDVIGNKTDTIAGNSIYALALQILASSGGVAGLQVLEKTFDLNQAAASYTLYTGTTQDVLIKNLVIRMPTGGAIGAVTGISIQTDDATPSVFISAAQGLLVNLTSESSLSWSSFGQAIFLVTGKHIKITIYGGAAGAPCVCNVACEYIAATTGGKLT